jgi:hypothetical protein
MEGINEYRSGSGGMPGGKSWLAGQKWLERKLLIISR